MTRRPRPAPRSASAGRGVSASGFRGTSRGSTLSGFGVEEEGREMSRALDRLGKTAATEIRHALRSSDPGEHRSGLRAAAEAIVEARSHFTAPDGSTDWRGKSWEYRRWLADVYGAAGVPPSDLNRVQGTVRYHVSNVLRERLDDATLEDLGLRTASARDRAAEQRAETRRIVQSVTGSGLKELDALRSLAAAEGLLKRIDAAALPELPGLSRKTARALLRDVSRHAERLSAALRGE